jgi:adenylate cyclase
MNRVNAQVTEIQRWLLSVPHVEDGGASFMAGLIEQLVKQGIPVCRASFGLMTKHPELVWRAVQWNEASGIATFDHARSKLAEPFFSASPVAELRRGTPSIRVELESSDGGYPICADLRAQGCTDYFAQALPFANGEMSYLSCATRAKGGFSDAALSTLRELAPALAQRVELESGYHATRALLEVYLGPNAGARVAQGGFRRGSGELIDAAIWFSDLRDFTVISDRSTPEAVVRLLDEYFEGVAGAVMDHGGEVLKFVGDAILAIFPTGSDRSAACNRALAAAGDALVALNALNTTRIARDDAPIAMGLALHVGPVMYGNIGAQNRLDFTVISAAVNEACRLESLCKPLATTLIMSEAFVQAAAPANARDLGLHTLKGVSAQVRAFTLEVLARA